jgi:phage terminase large subunit
MEEIQSVVKRVELFPAQFDAYNFGTQFGAAVSGVQSGKTFTGVYWTGKKIQEYPQGTGIIVAPTYKILQHATLKKFFDIFPQFRKHYKEQKGEIALPTGGTIYVRSADNPLGIEGITANWIWLDEGGMTSLLTWTVLRSRVSMTGGQILITTTPYNMGWLYTDFFRRWKDGQDKSLSFFTWRSIDNPYFTKDFYEAERGRLRPEEFARRYEGRFEKMTGLVWDLPAEQIIDPRDIMVKAEIRIMGVDWGFGIENPSAISVWYYWNKCWYKTDEWKQSQRTTAEIIQVLKNKMVEHHATLIYPDTAEPDRIEECRRAGLPMMETNKDVKGGISLIQQLIRERRIFIFNNCKETIAEWSMYHYPEPEENKESKDLPFKFNDHLCDADRYAIYSYQPIKPQMMAASKGVLPYYPELNI